MQGGGTPLFVASQQRHLEVVRLLSDAGADKDIAMQGGGTPFLSHLNKGARRRSVCSLMQGPTRTSHCKAVPLTCSSHLCMDTWRSSICSLTQEPTRISQCRVAPLPCLSHLGMDTWRWSICSLTQEPTRTSQCKVVPLTCSSHLNKGAKNLAALSCKGRQEHRRSG